MGGIMEVSLPMSKLQTLPPQILVHVGQSLNVPMKGLVATIELLDEDATVPFIARYRKEATGNLDEVQIRGIEEKLRYFRELQDRQETILASIQEQGKLTDELKARIEQTLEKSELEDLYLPYKPKRRTKATIAREKGLEPLAMYLWDQQPTGTPLDVFAAGLVSAEKGVASVDEALEGGPAHRLGNDQRGRRHSQDASPDDVRRRRLLSRAQNRGRSRRAGKVQDVLRLPRAGRSQSHRTACSQSVAARTRRFSIS